MDSKQVKVLDKIRTLIAKGENFVLNGGAGSGKTTSLTDVISYVLKQNIKAKIACITFTNIAAEEIKSRISIDETRLETMTIHEFLWKVIKNYQKNIKVALCELIKTGVVKYEGEQVLDLNWFKDLEVSYREWRNLEKGIISHDEIIYLAEYLFKNFPLINKILDDSFDLILIDEYQDTQDSVLDIFLNYLQQNKKKIVIGLFGDPMQSIYDKGVGNVAVYINDKTLHEVVKEDNWRSDVSVIDLINKIRNDGIQQKSMKNSSGGSVKFIYDNNDQVDIVSIKNHSVFSLFDFNNHEENKELYLTHKLISKQVGFENLLNCYKYSDNLTGDNQDVFTKMLFKIMEIIVLYENKKYNVFLKTTDFKIKINSDLVLLKNNIDLLKEYCDKKSIEEVVKLAIDKKIINPDDRLGDYISKNSDQYDKILKIQFAEFSNFYRYKDEKSPYSTQHNVKGAEFDNVFVILDNGKWNNYNFTYLFENREDKSTIVERTRKIFYVSCSRAKKNLVVYFNKPSTKVLQQAKEWFGEENVIEIGLNESAIIPSILPAEHRT